VIEQVERLGQQIGLRKACEVLEVPRSRVYRARQAKKAPRLARRPTPARALSAGERQQVLAELNSTRFQDQAPRDVYATLLDEGRYLCNWRTMYRILHEHLEVRERRNQLRHPAYVKPELLATRPNELWSWDITKLLGPSKWTYFYLYVILDVFSRYVVGWMVHVQETAHLAEDLIAETCRRQAIQPGELTLHADRGKAMTSKPLALLLADLGVTKTHSRPYVSNDNPYSEAQFRTLKYRPGYPQRFGCLQDARNWSRAFFNWYNYEHHHSGIQLLTPADVHFGRAVQVLNDRFQVLTAAYQQYPERFVKGPPKPQELPSAVWINTPKKSADLPECSQVDGWR
jgi:putative transposase